MAARRLGGSLLHGAQAVVAEERRQLVPRRFLSGVNKTADPKRQPRIFEEYPEGEIQQKKEELFKLMCEDGEQSVREGRNKHLLRYLTEHVGPWEDDPHWRQFNRRRKMTNWVVLMGPVSCLAANYFVSKDG